MSENNNSNLIKGSMIAISVKLNDLEKQIKQEKNVRRKLDLLAKQNKLLSYMTGIGIGFSTNDKSIMQKFRKRN